jgi:PilZ domain
MKELTTQIKYRNADAILDRRGEPRIPLKFSIEICGFDVTGHFFTERTMTCDVSNSGCKFILHVEMEKNSVVAIRLIHHFNGREVDSRPLLFEVVRIEQEPNGQVLGASKLQAERLWCADFPQPRVPANPFS